jgi:hypothetical protein
MTSADYQNATRQGCSRRAASARRPGSQTSFQRSLARLKEAASWPGADRAIGGHSATNPVGLVT